jgi:hypothetical protein
MLEGPVRRHEVRARRGGSGNGFTLRDQD